MCVAGQPVKYCSRQIEYAGTDLSEDEFDHVHLTWRPMEVPVTGKILEYRNTVLVRIRCHHRTAALTVIFLNTTPLGQFPKRERRRPWGHFQSCYIFLHVRQRNKVARRVLERENV